MKNSGWILATSLVVGLAISAGQTGCAGTKTAANDESQCQVVKPGVTTANKVCVIMNDDPVDPEVTPVVWKGQKYGLCCEGCRKKWNAKTDAQKDAAVAQALSMSR
ncbi:MAG TPA: hypothetical protein PKE29_07585 [Phycisphaerales bacterium]|nr:hypothetical protein [Phycisphaerales bacterium]